MPRKQWQDITLNLYQDLQRVRSFLLISIYYRNRKMVQCSKLWTSILLDELIPLNLFTVTFWIVRWAVFSQWIKILWKFKIPLRQAAARERVVAQNIAQGDLLHSFYPPPQSSHSRTEDISKLNKEISPENWECSHLVVRNNIHIWTLDR